MAKRLKLAPERALTKSGGRAKADISSEAKVALKRTLAPARKYEYFETHLTLAKHRLGYNYGQTGKDVL